MASNEFVVKLLADVTNFSQGMKEAEDNGSKLKDSLLKTGAALAGLFAATKIKEFIDDVVSAAKDVAAETGRLQALYGQSSAAVEAWAQTTAASFGIARGDAMGLSRELGQTLVGSFGMSAEAASKMSMEIIELSAKVSAYRRIPLDQVMNAVEKAMLGQTRGLKELGISMDVAQIKAKALEMGLADQSGEVDKAGMAQATYALLLDQTSVDQETWTKNSKSMGEQSKQTEAMMQDAKAAIGEAFLPALKELSTFTRDVLVPALTTLVQWLTENKAIVVPLAGAVLLLVTAVQLVSAAIAIYNAVAAVQAAWSALTTTNLFAETGAWIANAASKVAGTAVTVGQTAATIALAAASGVASAASAVWTGIQWLLNAALSANPIALVVIAIAALIAGIILAYNNCETFRNIVQAAFGIIKTVVQATASAFQAAGSAMASAFQAVIGVIQSILDKVQDLANKIKNLPGVGALAGALGMSAPGVYGAAMISPAEQLRGFRSGTAGWFQSGAGGGITLAPQYTLNLHVERASEEDVIAAFRRLEFMAGAA